MDEFIRVIGQLKPQNNSKAFPLADVNDLLGGYVQVDTLQAMNSIPTRKIRVGMLCYVKETGLIYQNTNNTWSVWKSGNDGTTLISVDTLDQLNNEAYTIKGTIAYITETDDLRWYNGTTWNTFNKIYIQDSQPTDTSGVWFDTKDETTYNKTDTIIQQLTSAITVLEQKLKQIQYAFDCEMDFGDFTNNKYYEYDSSQALEPIVIGDTIITQEVSSTGEPVGYKNIVPNCRHLKIKSGTQSQMNSNADNFLAAELLWCYDTQALWIKDPKTLKLIKIGSASDGPVIDDTVDGIITSIINSKNRITGIEFADMEDTSQIYLMSVKNGKLDLHNEALDVSSLASNNQTLDSTTNNYSDLYFPVTNTYSSPKVYINMFYCGGDSDKYSYNPVSHNFIELSNLNDTPLNLKGMYLHYTEAGNNAWLTLPLTGIIPAQGTFLIKGAQCSFENINTTSIKVGTPDMYWTKDATTTVSKTTFVQEPFDDNGYLKMNSICSIYLSGSDSSDFDYSKTALVGAPYISGQVIKYYVDLVGVGTYKDTAGIVNNQPCEKAPINTYGQDKLQVKYYTMDKVTQATKALSARANNKDWIYINLINPNSEITITDYQPKNTEENKTIFFNKHLIVGNKPIIVNCNFGYNAHTTRCFTWISKGYYDEYIKISTSSDMSNATQYESFKENDNNSERTINNRNNSIYNRVRAITTDGTAFTSHKFIKTFDEPTVSQTYYYVVGKEGSWSDIKQFTLYNRDYIITNGFKFVQVTDQQGFNQEEYKTWQLSADYIKANESVNFCLNTGDYTQNGNRINEWIDYFNGGNSLISNMEHIGTVGNNDLSPFNNYELGDGSDASKNNPINMRYFFTFEHPYEIPLCNGLYVESTYSFIYGNTYFLCMNSEITSDFQTNMYSDTDVYAALKTWSTNDLTKIDSKILWKIAFCHEMPFTILTESVIKNTINSGNATRGGSHLNTLGSYWFSKFLQTNGFKLCIGGHKHTYSKSYPLIETNSEMIPQIQVTTEILKNMTGDTLLYTADGTTKYTYNSVEYTADTYQYTKTDGTKEYCKFPLSWIVAQSSTDGTNYESKKLCTFDLVSSITAPVYVMDQATGYKLVSNKELPGQNIPWLEHYYPITSYKYSNGIVTGDTENKNQHYPHYIIWSIGKGTEIQNSNFTVPTTSRDRILGQTKKIILSGDNNKGINWAYTYNNPYTLSNLTTTSGNGDDNIIIE